MYVLYDIILFYFTFTFYSSNTTKIYRARLYRKSYLPARLFSSAIILSVLARHALILGGQTKNCTSKVRRGRGFVLADVSEITASVFQQSEQFRDRVMWNIHERILSQKFRHVDFHKKKNPDFTYWALRSARETFYSELTEIFFIIGIYQCAIFLKVSWPKRFTRDLDIASYDFPRKRLSDRRGSQARDPSLSYIQSV